MKLQFCSKFDVSLLFLCYDKFNYLYCLFISVQTQTILQSNGIVFLEPTRLQIDERLILTTDGSKYRSKKHVILRDLQHLKTNISDFVKKSTIWSALSNVHCIDDLLDAIVSFEKKH